MKNKVNFFDVINVVLIALAVLLIFIPMWYIFVISTSTYSAYINDPYHLIPMSFTLQEYKRAFLNSRDMLLSLWVTIEVTVLGTLISMLLTIMGGYALSKDGLPGRNIIFRLFIFPCSSAEALCLGIFWSGGCTWTIPYGR